MGDVMCTRTTSAEKGVQASLTHSTIPPTSGVMDSERIHVNSSSVVPCACDKGSGSIVIESTISTRVKEPSASRSQFQKH